MPAFSIRTAAEVPEAERPNRQKRNTISLYQCFIREIGDDVGELQVMGGECRSTIKMSLRRAAIHLGLVLDIWYADEKVYFRVAVPRTNARPRKASRRVILPTVI